jgi:hypothetical protein
LSTILGLTDPRFDCRFAGPILKRPWWSGLQSASLPAGGFGKADHAFDFTALPAARHSGHS